MNITVEEFEKQVNMSGDVFYKEILDRIKCLQIKDRKNLNEAVEELKTEESQHLS